MIVSGNLKLYLIALRAFDFRAKYDRRNSYSVAIFILSLSNYINLI